MRCLLTIEEPGWLNEQGGGLLCDEFDGCADNYTAFSETGELIGSVRVVPDGPLGLPLEHCLHLALYDRMGFEPLSEPYHDPSYRCDMPVVILALDVARAQRELQSKSPGIVCPERERAARLATVREVGDE